MINKLYNRHIYYENDESIIMFVLTSSECSSVWLMTSSEYPSIGAAADYAYKHTYTARKMPADFITNKFAPPAVSIGTWTMALGQRLVQSSISVILGSSLKNSTDSVYLNK